MAQDVGTLAGISVNRNLLALRAIGRLESADAESSRALERLSSGFRINRASDDAAGLAVAVQLDAESAILKARYRAINDSVSFLNVADGALQTIGTQIDRIRELASQAANGIYGTAQRTALDNEAQALREEINRILDTTTFNNAPVFSGDNPGHMLATGRDAFSGIAIGTSYAVRAFEGLGAFTASLTFADPANTYQAFATVNNDGFIDLFRVRRHADEFYVRLGNGDGTFTAKQTFRTGIASTATGTTADFDGDGIRDAVFVAQAGVTYGTILRGNADGTFRAPENIGELGQNHGVTAIDINGDGLMDLGSGDSTNYVLRIGNGDGTFQAPITGTKPVGYAFSFGDLNNDGKADALFQESNGTRVFTRFGNGDGTFKAAITYTTLTAPPGGSRIRTDFNQDGYIDIVSFDMAIGVYGVLLNNGNGTFKAMATYQTGGGGMSSGTSADINNDGIRDLLFAEASSATIRTFLGNGDGTFSVGRTIVAPEAGLSLGVNEVNGDGVIDLMTTNNSTGVGVLFLGERAPVAKLPAFTLQSVSGARSALDLMSESRTRLSESLAVLGSQRSRVLSILEGTAVTRENYTAASSRIMAADVAEESAAALRSSILKRVGAAVLAQANQQPRIALFLLGVE